MRSPAARSKRLDAFLDCETRVTPCYFDKSLVGVLDIDIFLKAEDGIRDYKVTGVQTCALPICGRHAPAEQRRDAGRDHGKDGLAEAHRARVHGGCDEEGRLQRRVLQIGQGRPYLPDQPVASDSYLLARPALPWRASPKFTGSPVCMVCIPRLLTERLQVRILFGEANISTSNSLALLVSGAPPPPVGEGQFSDTR